MKISFNDGELIVDGEGVTLQKNKEGIALQVEESDAIKSISISNVNIE